MDLEQRKKLAKQLRKVRTETTRAIRLLEDDGPGDVEVVSQETNVLQESNKSLKDHFAIQTYRDVFHSYPKKTLWQWIADNVDDDERWRAACSKWLLRGYNPNNVSGIYDFYQGTEVGATVQITVDGLDYIQHPDGTRELIVEETERS
jgi:hypothetical protein